MQNTAFDTFVYTPPAAFTGADVFTYLVGDGFGGAVTGTLTFNVVNGAPVFVADAAVNMRPGETATIIGADLVANDTDPDGDALQVTQFFATTAEGGTVQNTAFDTFVYTPPAAFTGADVFTYLVGDGFGGAVTGTLTFNVVNGAPVFVADAAVNIRPGETATIIGADLVANDTDPDGDALQVTQFFATTAEGGTVQNTAFDTFVYTPPAAFTGADVFTYVVGDGFGGAVTGTLTFNVVNGAPVFVADAAVNLRPGETATVIGADLVANDTDPDGDALQVTQFFATTAEGGTVQNTAFDTFVYTPPAAFTGADVFTYLVGDGFGGAVTGTLTFNVVNGAVGFARNDDFRGTIGGGEIILFSALLSNDDAGLTVTGLVGMTPVAGSPDTYVLSTANAFVTVDMAGELLRVFHLGSAPDVIDLEYAALDEQGNARSALITVQVDNTAPLAVDQSFAVVAGGSITLQWKDIVFAPGNSDPDGDPFVLAFYGFLDPAFGTLQGFGPADPNDPNDFGSILYTPAAGFTGTASISYGIQDVPDLGGAQRFSPYGQATLSFVVTADTNAAPAAGDDAYSVQEGRVLTIGAPGLLANDSDADGDAIIAFQFFQPANGTVNLVTDGSFTYTPNAGFAGIDSFVYIITDGVATAQATVTITVEEGNPTPGADNYTVLHDTVLTIPAPGCWPTIWIPTAMRSARSSLPAGQRYGEPGERRQLDLHAERRLRGNRQLRLRRHRRDNTGQASVTISVTNGAPTAGDDAYSVKVVFSRSARRGCWRTTATPTVTRSARSSSSSRATAR